MEPSRAKALHHRHLLLLRPDDQSSSGAAVDKPAWPWMARPRTIQKQSAGLGMYFRTLLYFCAIMLLLGALAVIPLISNLRNQNFSGTYDLAVTAQDGTPAQIVDRCFKSFEVGGFVLDLSLGAFCAQSPYSGQFDCPATCVYDTSRRALPLCNGVTELATLCNSTLPCSQSDACTGDNPDSEECCSCCNMVLNDEELSDVPVYQAWIWCTVGTLAWAVWLAFLKKMQANISAETNARTITAADYTVWVSRLAGADGNDSELRSFAEHYGQVISAFHICNVGTVLNLNNQIEEAELRLAEARQLLVHDAPGKAGLKEWIYKRSIAGVRSVASQRQRLEAQLTKLKQQFEAVQQGDLQTTGTALVTFNYARHKQNMVIDHSRSIKLADTIFAPGLIRLFHVFTGGVFSGAPRIPVMSKGKNTNCFVTVQRAPEPADVWWENAATASHGGYRRVLSWLAYLILVAVSCGIQGLLTYLAEQERGERIQTSRQAEMGSSLDAGTSSGLGPGALGPGTLDAIQDSVSLRILSVVQGLSVSILNIGVGVLIPMVTDFERNLTATSAMLSLVIKLSVFYILNSFVVPIAVVTALPGSDGLWYTRGGIVEAAFYIQAINAVLPDLVSVFDVSRLMKFRFLSYMARTQAYMNAALEPPPFDLPLRFASAIRTVALGVLYAPVLPISPMISAVGLMVSFLADQFLALHVSRKPREFDVDAIDAVNYIIELLPMAQMLLILLVYFKDADGIVPPFIVGTVIWAVLFLVPLGRLARCARDRNQEEDGTRDLSFDVFRHVGLQATAANHRATGIGSAYTYNPAADLGPGTAIVAEFYFPSVSKRVSPTWSRNLSSRIDLRLSGPNTELLQHGRWQQRARTGGPEATEPPPLEVNRVVKLKPATINQDALEDPSFYPQPAFILDISFAGPGTDATPSPSSPPLGPAAPAAALHPSAPMYSSGEQSSVTYLLDTGDPHRLQQPGFYPSPFAPSSDLDSGPAAVSAHAPACHTSAAPTYHGTSAPTASHSSPADGSALVHPLHTLVAPMAPPTAPHAYPTVGPAMNGDVHGPDLHYPAPAMPNAAGAAAHVTPSAPPIPAAPAFNLSASHPSPYPSPAAYNAQPAPAYPDMRPSLPPHAAARPTYHLDQKPAV